MANEIEILFTARDKTREATQGVTRNLAVVRSAAAGVQSAWRSAAAFLTGPTGAITLIGTAITALGAGQAAQAIRNSITQLDALAKTSERIGVGVEALQELQFAAQVSGVPIQTLELGIQRFGRRIGEASLGTGELVKGLDLLEQRGLGVRIFDESGRKLRDVDSIFRDFLRSLSQIEDVQIRNAIAMKAFDTEGVALVQIAAAGADAVDRLSAEARDLGAVLDASIIAQAVEAKSQLDALSRVIDANLSVALVRLAPLLISTTTLLARGAQAVGDFADRFTDFADLPDAKLRVRLEVGETDEVERLRRELLNLERERAVLAQSTLGRPEPIDLAETLGLKDITPRIEAFKADLADMDRRISEFQRGIQSARDVPVVPEIEGQIRVLERQLDVIEQRLASEPNVFERLIGAEEIEANTRVLHEQRDRILATIKDLRKASERRLTLEFGPATVDESAFAQIHRSIDEASQSIVQAQGHTKTLDETLGDLRRQMQLASADTDDVRNSLKSAFQFRGDVAQLTKSIEGLSSETREGLVAAAEQGADAFRAMVESIAVERVQSRLQQITAAFVAAQEQIERASQGQARGFLDLPPLQGPPTAAALAGALSSEDAARLGAEAGSSYIEGLAASLEENDPVLQALNVLLGTFEEREEQLAKARIERAQKTQAQIERATARARAETLALRFEIVPPTQAEVEDVLANLDLPALEVPLAGLSGEDVARIVTLRGDLSAQLEDIARTEDVTGVQRRAARLAAEERFAAQVSAIGANAARERERFQRELAVDLAPVPLQDTLGQLARLEEKTAERRTKAASQGAAALEAVERAHAAERLQILQGGAQELLDAQRDLELDLLTTEEAAVQRRIDAVEDEFRERMEWVRAGLLEEQEVREAFAAQIEAIRTESDPFLRAVQVDLEEIASSSLKTLRDNSVEAFGQFVLGAKSGKEALESLAQTLQQVSARIVGEAILGKAIEAVAGKVRGTQTPDPNSPEAKIEAAAAEQAAAAAAMGGAATTQGVAGKTMAGAATGMQRAAVQIDAAMQRFLIQAAKLGQAGAPPGGLPLPGGQGLPPILLETGPLEEVAGSLGQAAGDAAQATDVSAQAIAQAAAALGSAADVYLGAVGQLGASVAQEVATAAQRQVAAASEATSATVEAGAAATALEAARVMNDAAEKMLRAARELADREAEGVPSGDGLGFLSRGLGGLFGGGGEGVFGGGGFDLGSLLGKAVEGITNAGRIFTDGSEGFGDIVRGSFTRSAGTFTSAADVSLDAGRRFGDASVGALDAAVLQQVASSNLVLAAQVFAEAAKELAESSGGGSPTFIPVGGGSGEISIGNPWMRTDPGTLSPQLLLESELRSAKDHMASLAHGGVTTQEGFVAVHPKELIVPLDDLSRLVPNLGGINISQTITIDGTGRGTSTQDSDSQEREASLLGRAINEAIVETIRGEQRPGGLLEGTGWRR